MSMQGSYIRSYYSALRNSFSYPKKDKSQISYHTANFRFLCMTWRQLQMDLVGLSSSLKSHWERDSPRFLLRMPTLHADCVIFKEVLHPCLGEVLWDLFFSCNNCPVSYSMPWLNTEDEERVSIGSQADEQRKSDSGVLTYVLIVWGWFLGQCSKDSEHKSKQRMWPQKCPVIWLLFIFH